jgi:hypothetical protein
VRLAELAQIGQLSMQPYRLAQPPSKKAGAHSGDLVAVLPASRWRANCRFQPDALRHHDRLGDCHRVLVFDAGKNDKSQKFMFTVVRPLCIEARRGRRRSLW